MAPGFAPQGVRTGQGVAIREERAEADAGPHTSTGSSPPTASSLPSGRRCGSAMPLAAPCWKELQARAARHVEEANMGLVRRHPPADCRRDRNADEKSGSGSGIVFEGATTTGRLESRSSGPPCCSTTARASFCPSGDIVAACTVSSKRWEESCRIDSRFDDFQEVASQRVPSLPLHQRTSR